jgi:hypothetical protein
MFLMGGRDRPPDLRHIQVDHPFHPVKDMNGGLEKKAIFGRTGDEFVKSSIQSGEGGQITLAFESR